VTDYVSGGRRLGDVPRTTEAEGADAVSRAVRARLGPPAAWWGMVILIASEATLFATFVATYFYLRVTSPSWPQGGLPAPKALVPLILLACLVATSVPMQLASLAARAGRIAAARLFILSALVVQAAYFGYEVYDYRNQLHDFGLGRNAYSSIYYTLLGADHAHVALGILFNLWLLGKLASGLTTYRMNATQAITWYWHAVNAITVVVFATLLSPRL
jgi:cytochrome c oxidase subunit 3/cytochrome c oxidase subunit I+III